MILSLVLGFWGYIAHKSRARSLPKMNKYGPLLFATIAVFLIPIIPGWKLAADLGFVPLSSVWKPHCDQHGIWVFFQIKCLNPLGWFFTIFGTWLGNICLAISMFYEMDFIKKMKHRYRRAQYGN